MSIELWLALLGASILISVSPGAGAATAISSGLSHGLRGAAPAVLGLIAGYGTQLLIVGLGLGAIVANAEQLFNLIKYIGAAYLVWLGLQMILSQRGVEFYRSEPLRRRVRFSRAYLVNITNPKGLVFLMALIPQFLDLTKPQTPQLIIIAFTLLIVDWAVMTGYSGIASRMRHFFSEGSGPIWLNRGSGFALILAGIVLSTATL